MRQPEPRSLADRCRDIELLIVDVDGVLTDGKIVYTDAGDQIKSFHVRDGSALKCWHDFGKQTAIISGRHAASVKARAQELGIKTLFQGAHDKLAAFHKILGGTRLDARQACAMGDDLADLHLLRSCGLAIAVEDACPEISRAAHYVTRVAGGQGAVREAIELILKCQGRWKSVVDDPAAPGQGG
jgi:3-deoxy-D-manno-octulosonate 8-phosphate phosphatase (KDO 8-P phosphatase)